MKKLMIAASAAFCATVGFGELASANIVGYANKTLPANKFIQAGAQFFDVATDKLTLDTVMKGLPEVYFDDELAFQATAPHIQVVAVDGTPTKYYYLQDAYYVDENDEEQFKPGWCDWKGNLVNLEITPGSGFWMKNADVTDQTLVGYGAVSAPDSYEVTAPGGVFSINANVYPIAVDLNDSNQVEYPDMEEVYFDDELAFQAVAPHIQVVAIDGTPTKYYYLQDGYYEDEDGNENFKPGWCDWKGNLVSLVIQPQSGFWVKAPAKGLTFKYKK